jgi:uncharacterized membrane protein
MAGAAEVLGSIVLVGTKARIAFLDCYSARGPDADRRARSLIRLVQAGSRTDPDSQA